MDGKLPPGEFHGWLIILSAPTLWRETKQLFIKKSSLRFDENKLRLLIPKGRVSNYVTGKERHWINLEQNCFKLYDLKCN